MPSFSQLNGADLAALLTYLGREFGTGGLPITLQQVAAMRASKK